MDSGKLRHKVSLQSLVEGSPNLKPSGEPDAVWTDVLTNVSASIEPLRGRELFAAQEHHSEVTTRIRIRYRDGVTAAQRVKFGTRVLNILAVLNREERDIELELMCSEGLNDG